MRHQRTLRSWAAAGGLAFRRVLAGNPDRRCVGVDRAVRLARRGGSVDRSSGRAAGGNRGGADGRAGFLFALPPGDRDLH